MIFTVQSLVKFRWPSTLHLYNTSLFESGSSNSNWKPSDKGIARRLNIVIMLHGNTTFHVLDEPTNEPL